jgi:hypothetical protein
LFLFALGFLFRRDFLRKLYKLGEDTGEPGAFFLKLEPLGIGIQLDEDIAGLYLLAQYEVCCYDPACSRCLDGVDRSVYLQARHLGGLVQRNPGEEEPCSPGTEDACDEAYTHNRAAETVRRKRACRAGKGVGHNTPSQKLR